MKSLSDLQNEIEKEQNSLDALINQKSRIEDKINKKKEKINQLNNTLVIALLKENGMTAKDLVEYFNNNSVKNSTTTE